MQPTASLAERHVCKWAIQRNVQDDLFRNPKRFGGVFSKRIASGVGHPVPPVVITRYCNDRGRTK
jgi:hypothetical protein